MKIYIYTTSLLFFVLISNTKAQENLSFYNLNDYVIQTQNISPVYLPKYKYNFGTPLNFGGNINSSIKLNDILVENGNNLKIDLNNLNSVAEDNNFLASEMVVNIFMLGIKTKRGSISFFQNIKSNLTGEFSNNMTEIAANGFVESFSSSSEKIGLTAYSEIGVGITRTFLKEKLAIGLRLKYLSGIAHAELEDSAQFSLDIDPTNFLWTLNSSNVTLNTSGGTDIDKKAVFGQNAGFGMDFGISYKLNDKFSFDFSANDLGSINWTEDVTNYNLEDATDVVYNGIEFENRDNVRDDLENALRNIIDTNESNNSFKSNIGSKILFSSKYQMSEKNVFRATYFSNNTPHADIKPSFGLGYNRELNKSTYGVIASTGGINGGFKVGANLAVQLGFLQLYGAIDDLSSLNGKVEQIKEANLRLGINFLFGYSGKSNDEKLEENLDENLEEKDQLLINNKVN